MKIIKNEIDSDVFGKNFLEIIDYSPNDDFNLFEEDYLNDYSPYYVTVKIAIENIRDIHFFEQHGFNFIETQIRETLKLKNLYNHISFFPYKLEQISNELELETILEIASNLFKHDRFSIDSWIPGNFSGDRYRVLVRKSFDECDEFVYKFYNTVSGEILGFKTHKIIAENEALMFLGGIVEKYKKSPLPGICGYLELNELFKKGIRKITTHISGCNYGVLNLEVKEFGYKVTKVFIVLRKIYE